MFMIVGLFYTAYCKFTWHAVYIMRLLPRFFIISGMCGGLFDVFFSGGLYNIDDCDNNTHDRQANIDNSQALTSFCTFHFIFHMYHLQNTGSPPNVLIWAKGEPRTVLVTPCNNGIIFYA